MVDREQWRKVCRGPCQLARNGSSSIVAFGMQPNLCCDVMVEIPPFCENEILCWARLDHQGHSKDLVAIERRQRSTLPLMPVLSCMTLFFGFPFHSSARLRALSAGICDFSNRKPPDIDLSGWRFMRWPVEDSADSMVQWSLRIYH